MYNLKQKELELQDEEFSLSLKKTQKNKNSFLMLRKLGRKNTMEVRGMSLYNPKTIPSMSVLSSPSRSLLN